MSRGAGNYLRFTDAEKAEMNRLRQRGYSYREIAIALGAPESIPTRSLEKRRIADWFRLSRDAWRPTIMSKARLAPKPGRAA